MVFRGKNQHVHYHDLYLQNNIIERVGEKCKENFVRFLGIWIDESLSFSGHLAKLKSKLNSGIYALATCTKVVPFRVRKMIYHSLFESHLHFSSIIYGATSTRNMGQIETVQRKAIRVLTRSRYNAHRDPPLGSGERRGIELLRPIVAKISLKVDNCAHNWYPTQI